MTKYNSFAELNAYYAKRYGDDWGKRGRGCLDEAEQQEWIDACYDLYPKEYKLRDTFKAEDGESWQHDGKRFNILRQVDFDTVYEETRPIYEIQFIDKTDTVHSIILLCNPCNRRNIDVCEQFDK